MAKARMVYKLVASSRSGATEVFRGEDGSLVQIQYFRSGRAEAMPVPEIGDELTVRYADGRLWETEPIPPEGVIFPAIQ